jgi:uncharacterized protein (TIGR02996 family)
MSLMTEPDWLALIEADPDDVGLRLVFADWLEEQQDPRAQGVRWQVDHGKMPRPCCLHDGAELDWCWWDARMGQPVEEFDDLPVEIWRHLNREPDPIYSGFESFPTRLAAEQALWQAIALTKENLHEPQPCGD